MNAKKFSDAMSELDNKYIDEALNYKLVQNLLPLMLEQTW